MNGCGRHVGRVYSGYLPRQIFGVQVQLKRGVVDGLYVGGSDWAPHDLRHSGSFHRARNSYFRHDSHKQAVVSLAKRKRLKGLHAALWRTMRGGSLNQGWCILNRYITSYVVIQATRGPRTGHAQATAVHCTSICTHTHAHISSSLSLSLARSLARSLTEGCGAADGE